MNFLLIIFLPITEVLRFIPDNITYQAHNHLHVFEDTDCNSLFNHTDVSETSVVNYRTNDVCVGNPNGIGFLKNYPLKKFNNFCTTLVSSAAI